MDLISLLLSTYLFADLHPEEIVPLAARARRHFYQRGEYVFRVGDPATALYVTASGQLKESVVSVSGEEIIFEIFTTGAVFGEPGLFAREKDRVVDVAAMQPSVVVAIPREPLVDFLLCHSATMLRLLEGLTAQVRTSVEELSSVAFRKIQERLVLKLLELAETHGKPSGSVTTVSLQLPQRTLAAMIGASRENVNRALAVLVDTGDVQIWNTGQVVLDTSRLRRRVGEQRPLLHRRNGRDLGRYRIGKAAEV